MAKKSEKKLDRKPTAKDKKQTVEEHLYSIDMANRQLAHTISCLSNKINIDYNEIAEEINILRTEISRLNETIYEDRRVLADFVTKFFKDTKTVLNPALAIDGGKKAKAK